MELTFHVAIRIVSSMPHKRAITTEQAPKAVGPYSQAIVANGFVFCSGQIPLDPATGKLIDSPDIGDHVRRVMENLRAVLDAAGSDFSKVVKTTIFVAQMSDFPEVNKAYAEYFTDVPPARATVQAGGLPLGARVEIEMTALAS
jgi:2-iminobutanoate/2-iminopropanoate deaminase